MVEPGVRAPAAVAYQPTMVAGQPTTAKLAPDLTVGAAAIGGGASGKEEEAPVAAAPSLDIMGGAWKEGLQWRPAPLRGEALAAVSGPPTAEPSGGAAGKRVEGAPAAASSPPMANSSRGTAGKREEEATGAMKVKTSLVAEPRPAAPMAWGADPAVAMPYLVAAVIDLATTMTCCPP
ncbi:hypothetical protein GUJ93_ZPchr0009g1802 [Zizania palustris]|uniref:Uncharacterized protein n=1 Tax=Zizania palustris TaxID=103762 RepID=A0A8J5R153_ZIZPA|nr:hypothetical protein GUJ93_ZPchr0009g1802 [Zizania palustris]